MNISFGIPLTPGYNREYVQNLIDSIDSQSDFDYEIIVCGEYQDDIHSLKPLVYVPFDESVRPKWITAKKNRIVERAQHEDICILHDYYLLDEDWLDGVVDYGRYCNDNWNVLTNRIFTYEGKRHSDWLVNQKYMDQVIERHPHLTQQLIDAAPEENNGARWVCGLPYSEQSLKHIQYISGGYILAKAKVFRDVPFDERFVWGEAAEDIIWSEAVIEKGYRFDYNPFSIVTLQKPGKWQLCEMTPECVRRLKSLFGENL